ncbi:hypothetical protein G3I60_14495 [Streptomyces sp. SID13666]|uniref:hypothetical protein n=1 Tax=unclassified Streptomyces TaxID=2593676 RepID=UPI0013C201C1|nr:MULTISPECIES: hypothetical protein [unclassified Streptomyces]NEA55326.1 hypothetical protein [Streptomyces sp. SID13666]NEA73532.1 hypothetical protein [Streptomyces sp. SID13588]
MTKQIAEPIDEASETTSVPKRVKGLIKRNKEAIIGVGAAAAFVGFVLLKHATKRHITEDIESSEPTELDEPAAREEKFTSGRCADGTSSDSIGKQGACSHHGGVAA